MVIHPVRQQPLAFKVVLNANSALCNQQPCDNVSSSSVTGTAQRSHECTATTAQRSTSKEHSPKPLGADATYDRKNNTQDSKNQVALASGSHYFTAVSQKDGKQHFDKLS